MRLTRSCAPARTMRCNGEVFNVGGTEPISHRELTSLLIAAAGAGRVEYVEWPTRQEGDRHRQLLRGLVEIPHDHRWTPPSRLREGLASTLAYYRAHFEQYADAEDRQART